MEYNMRMTMKYLIALSLVMVLLLPAAAQADCINPAGKEGEVRFNDDYLVFQGCDGTDWQAFHDPHCPAGNGCPPPLQDAAISAIPVTMAQSTRDFLPMAACRCTPHLQMREYFHGMTIQQITKI